MFWGVCGICLESYFRSGITVCSTCVCGNLWDVFSSSVAIDPAVCWSCFFFYLNTEHKDVRLVTLCTQLLGQMLVWNLVLVKLDSGPKARMGHNIVVKESYHCFCACERWANSELHVPECPV